MFIHHRVGAGCVIAVLLAAVAAGHAAPLAARTAADCSGTSTGMVPLSELGGWPYQGFPGGLYPGGGNQPPAQHRALALAAAGEVRPRAADGSPATDGRVVLLSLGMSNATQEFSAFVAHARNQTFIRPEVAIVDGAQGGQTASIIRDPRASFWQVVDQRLAAAGVTARQVQVVWLKEANAQPRDPFPAHALALSDDLEADVRVAADRFPNLKLIYLSSRTYGGYASTALNPEPYAYESGFAVRWLIERQIAGDPELNPDPAKGAVRAPVLLWGPYLWADGLTARGDGLLWRCQDFGDDGTHPSASGRAKVASMLMRFFRTDVTARPWFVAGGAAPTATAPSASATPSATSPTPVPTRPTPTAAAFEAYLPLACGHR
jgi:hypothetical protein